MAKQIAKIKVGVISLGCPKNLADMEAVFSFLNNVEMAPVEDSSIVFLNTCGFLKAARQEIFDNLKQLNDKKVIVLGCYASRFGAKEFKKYPQIKALVSSVNYSRMNEILTAVASGKKITALAAEPIEFEPALGKTLLTQKPYAYVKIAEGCWSHCSYCLIPKLKGEYRSRPMEQIIEEARALVKVGIHELILVAQDCGYYGTDLYGKKSLSKLLTALAKIKGDFWIRVLYVYPEMIDAELLSVIKNNKKICRYLDIPLQHGDPRILKLMNRPNDLMATYKKIALITEILPDVTLRTSLIVGFPGEGEREFNNLLKFIGEIKFDHVGVFSYSREPETVAAKFPGQVPEKIKKARREAALLLQQEVSLRSNRKVVGKVVLALVDSYDRERDCYIARSSRFSPDVDGVILIKIVKPLRVGQFVKVKITGADEYDLQSIIK